MLDVFSYTIYPNMFIFPGISLPLVYRFRPNPDNHRECIYEVMFLQPKPKDGSAVSPAEPVHLTRVSPSRKPQAWTRALAAILDQDTDNLILQQDGLEASAKHALTLGNYQEIRVRHFEKAVDKYMAMEPKKPDREKLPSR